MKLEPTAAYGLSAKARLDEREGHLPAAIAS